MKKRRLTNKLIIHTVLIAGAILTLIPFVWMILTSLKTIPESMAIPPQVLPESLNFGNFREAFETLPFARMYYNTIMFTLVTTIGQVLFCSMAGYVFARMEFFGKNFLFIMVLSVLMVPGQIFIIPQFQIITALNLSNTITALFLPNLFSAFGTFLMRQFFITIPKEVEEAAIMDGANHFTIFYKVMLPLVKPGIVALGISTSLFAWNSLLWPLIVNTSRSSMTLSAGLSTLQGIHVTNYPLLMAAALLAIWPMIIVFIMFQRQFIEGIANTGGK